MPRLYGNEHSIKMPRSFAVEHLVVFCEGPCRSSGSPHPGKVINWRLGPVLLLFQIPEIAHVGMHTSEARAHPLRYKRL
jgi:hypothetical protein